MSERGKNKIRDVQSQPEVLERMYGWGGNLTIRTFDTRNEIEFWKAENVNHES